MGNYYVTYIAIPIYIAIYVFVCNLYYQRYPNSCLYCTVKNLAIKKIGEKAAAKD